MLHSSSTFSQTLYLIKADESAGTFNNVNSIPGAEWVAVGPNSTTFDGKNERYIFAGSPDDITFSLYSLDAKTGNIITKAPYPVSFNSPEHLELQYGNSTNTLYGLHWDNNGKAELVSVDLTTGAYTSIAPLPGVAAIDYFSTTFDNNHNLIIFVGTDANGNVCLYSVSVSSGAIVTKPKVSKISNIQYDNITGNLYGIYEQAGNLSFVSINSITGAISNLATLTGIGYIDEGATLDDRYHKFTFAAYDQASGEFLYTVDATTGNIISKVPKNLTSSVKVVLYRYDNVSDELYALHWETDTTVAFTLGNDTTLCEGQTITYNFIIDSALYQWNTGSTSNKFTIDSAGTYILTITKGNNSFSDTISVRYNPSPSVYLGNDTILCEKDSLELNATNNNSTYRWQDGSTAPTYNISKAGKYFVTVDMNGCSNSDTITVSYKTRPVFSLGNDTTLCKGQTLLLHPAITDATSYLWQDGTHLPDYLVTDTGNFHLEVSNECGVTSDVIKVSEGICELFVPTGFTPNRDGLNDVFRVKYAQSFKQFHMAIYNRWGEKIFETELATSGWDGTYKALNNQLVRIYG